MAAGITYPSPATPEKCKAFQDRLVAASSDEREAWRKNMILINRAWHGLVIVTVIMVAAVLYNIFCLYQAVFNSACPTCTLPRLPANTTAETIRFISNMLFTAAALGGIYLSRISETFPDLTDKLKAAPVCHAQDVVRIKAIWDLMKMGYSFVLSVIGANAYSIYTSNTDTCSPCPRPPASTNWEAWKFAVHAAFAAIVVVRIYSTRNDMKARKPLDQEAGQDVKSSLCTVFEHNSKRIPFDGPMIE